MSSQAHWDKAMLDDEPAEATGGWHAALAGAVLGAGLAGWGLMGDAAPTDALTKATTAGPATWAEPVRATTPLTARHAATQAAAASAAPGHAAAATIAGGPAPVQYVGQWVNGGRQAVVISHHGRSVVVQVPGMVDGRFEVVSANDRELVLRDLGLGTTQRIAFAVAPATAAAAGIAETAPTDDAAEDTTTVRVRPAKLPPLSKRTSDDVEPEN